MGAARAAAPRRSDEPVAPTFHEYASAWLRGKVQGVLGDKPIDANTESDYRWRLIRHLLPFFASYRIDAIDRELCLAFKAHKLQEAAELRAALAAGADLRDRRGRPARPLGPASIRKLIDTLAAILEEAVEDGLLDRNPARGKRMKVRVPKPRRTFLEMDELAALLQAAEDQERSPLVAVPIDGTASDARPRGAVLAAGGHAAERDRRRARARQVDRDVPPLASSGVANAEPYIGRRAIVEMLGRSGVRVSELCDLRIGDARLHDRTAHAFRIPDAKTEAGHPRGPAHAGPRGRRYRAPRPAAGRRPPGRADAHLFPNTRGGRIARQRVGEILHEAAALATERLEAAGSPAAAARPRRTRFAGPTSRSRCSRTTST